MTVICERLEQDWAMNLTIDVPVEVQRNQILHLQLSTGHWISPIPLDVGNDKLHIKDLAISGSDRLLEWLQGEEAAVQWQLGEDRLFGLEACTILCPFGWPHMQSVLAVLILAHGATADLESLA